MKWAKSRNSKKLRSASRSLGTVPGCRSASSETIRGDAEPTWWTCSSALGRRAMKSDRLIRRSLSAELVEPETDGRRQQAEQQPRGEQRLLVDDAYAGHREQPDHGGDDQQPRAGARGRGDPREDAE